MNRVVVIGVLTALMLSGCSGDKGGEELVVDDVPDEIDQQTVSELEEEIAAKFPRRFSFPGQAELEPKQFTIPGVVAATEGSGSVEIPNDNGPCYTLIVNVGCYEGSTNTNQVIQSYDISEHVPVGQPAELRIKLKWPGNPGSSADLDIYLNVPGTHTSYDPDSWDESMNWGIITKFAVVNTVHKEGEPFELGVQVSNGKVLTDDMEYEITVDVEYGYDVVAPGIPYAIDVPANASRLVIESEPLGGDEHITGQYLIIDPNDELLRHEKYNDIGNDARAVTVREAGEYVVYAPNLRGGFLKVSTDVPNEGYQARILDTDVASGSLASQVLPPTGESGTFEVSSFPLEMHAWLRASDGAPGGVSGTAQVNLTSPDGWVTTTTMGAYVGGGDAGWVGQRIHSVSDGANLATGSYGWTVEGSAAAAMDAGYRMVTYTR